MEFEAMLCKDLHEYLNFDFFFENFVGLAIS